ncbi:MAG: exodeoxyribonuclease VII small subunit [Propionibacteriaceae bacterium]|nr:exodeoxyribonuclease VII small subunit [Propionibacteriaceae bacterium]
MAASKTPKTPEETGSPDPDLSDLSYEQARDELIAVVNRLESGGESLAESMELFKRGEQLANLCERYLQDARATVEAANQE